MCAYIQISDITAGKSGVCWEHFSELIITESNIS